MAVENRVVVITGATGGLGRVAARRFAEQGARLALFSRDAEKLQALAQELSLPGSRIMTGAYDFADPQAALAAADAVQQTFGRAEIVLHLVGGWIGGKAVVDLPPADLSTMLAQHVWTTFNMAQAFAPQLAANGWGRIIVVSSPAAADPSANGAAYSIAKAGQEALIATLAEELKARGVTANVLRVRSIDPRPEYGAAPDEIAAMMLCLCSDAARAVNGARIPLYGSS